MDSLTEKDKQYKDYLERRDREVFNNKLSKKTQSPLEGDRFEPESLEDKKAKEELAKTGKKFDSSQLKGDGTYNLPNNIYRPSGYNQHLAELGEDPLTSVRTMRNNMRKRALYFHEQDTPVRAHLCQAACDELTQAEEQLLRMNQERSNAILYGEIEKAELVKKQMEQFKETVIRNTYADLVMERNEMKAFGVESLWSPNVQLDRSQATNNPNSEAATSSNSEEQKSFSPLGPSERFQPLTSLPARDSIDNFEKSRFEGTPYIMSGNDQYEVRKNARLADFSAYPYSQERTNQSDNPYDIPRYASPYSRPNNQNDKTQSNDGSLNSSMSSTNNPNSNGKCNYCELTAFHLMSQAGMDDHHKRECKLMNICRYCVKVVLVPQLTDHYLNRCNFLRDRMVRCVKCGLAVDRSDQQLSILHPLCRGRNPPSGAVWCPLCSVAVDDNQSAWREHLTTKCFDNPRQNGPEDLRNLTEMEQDNSYDSRNGRTGKGGKGGKGGSVTLTGRLIDADKLVAALQEVQLMKKKKKKEAMASILEQK